MGARRWVLPAGCAACLALIVATSATQQQQEQQQPPAAGSGAPAPSTTASRLSALFSSPDSIFLQPWDQLLSARGLVAAAREFWAIIGPGGKLHPAYFLEHKGHLVVEGVLLATILYMFLQTSFKPNPKAEEPLTDRVGGWAVALCACVGREHLTCTGGSVHAVEDRPRVLVVRPAGGGWAGRQGEVQAATKADCSQGRLWPGHRQGRRGALQPCCSGLPSRLGLAPVRATLNATVARHNNVRVHGARPGLLRRRSTSCARSGCQSR